MVNEQELKQETASFHKQICPFGYGDVDALVQTALEAGKDGEWAGEQITQYIEDTGEEMGDLDPVCIIFEALLQEARTEIEDLTGKDILNDTEEQIYVAGNFMCTSLDYSTLAQSELKAIMDTIPKKNYTKVLNWLYSEADL